METFIYIVCTQLLSCLIPCLGVSSVIPLRLFLSKSLLSFLLLSVMTSLQLLFDLSEVPLPYSYTLFFLYLPWYCCFSLCYFFLVFPRFLDCLQAESLQYDFTLSIPPHIVYSLQVMSLIFLKYDNHKFLFLVLTYLWTLVKVPGTKNFSEFMLIF